VNRTCIAALLLAVPLGMAACRVADSAPELPRQVTSPKPGLTAKTAPARVNPAVVLDADPDWKYAASEIYKNERELDAMEARLVGTGLEKYVLRRGHGPAKRVTLTFDDGPHPAYTPPLLDMLRAKRVKATFFVIGHMADKYPDLVRRIAAEGHEVANHTYSHVTLTKIPPEEVEVEYKANDDVIRRLTGRRARYCRPPGGDHSPEVLRRAAGLGLTTVLWTDDPGDYENPGPDVLFARETKALSPGGIILLHDGSKDTLATLERFIDTARQSGYDFVSLDALRQ
jgi:peptidoglycan/xylan/chitin deacetylase (PgdA/CDA1 family)